MIVQPVKVLAASKLNDLNLKRYSDPPTCSQMPWPGVLRAWGTPEVESNVVPPAMKMPIESKLLISAPVAQFRIVTRTPTFLRAGRPTRYRLAGKKLPFQS